MPLFLVKAKSSYVQRWIVNASSAEEALERWDSGGGEFHSESNEIYSVSATIDDVSLIEE